MTLDLQDPNFQQQQCFEELSWNAEEMAFIRMLGERFELANMYPEPPLEMLQDVLAPLQATIRADALAFAAAAIDDSCLDGIPACYWSGSQLVGKERCRQIAARLTQRIIDNELDEEPAGKNGTVITSLAVVGVGNFHNFLGHFVAFNSQHPDGFGTREAGLLRTVAALFTTYACPSEPSL